MHLMQSLFGLHDRSVFEVIAYSYGPEDGSDYRRRAMHDCDRFEDIARLSVLESAAASMPMACRFSSISKDTPAKLGRPSWRCGRRRAS